MSLALDKTYINFLSSRLDRFSWIRTTLGNCRCPLCFEGTSKTKRRFYFYIHDSSSSGYSVKCHNCGYASLFRTFLEEYDGTLFQEYRVESFKEYFGDSYRGAKPKEEEVVVHEPPKRFTEMFDATMISLLPDGHTCKEYVRDRKIPMKFWDKLYFHNSYKTFISNFLDEEYWKNIPDDPRLIIPGYDANGKLKFFQGRSLEKDSRIRYVTMKLHDDFDKIYGEERVDRSRQVRVCEGPIDSLFVDNCLASCDADLLKAKGDVYIFDNQYRNSEICRRIEKAIELGANVVLFPPQFGFKDINDAVINGVTTQQIDQLIRDRTFAGMRARLEFGRLRKCR